MSETARMPASKPAARAAPNAAPKSAGKAAPNAAPKPAPRAGGEVGARAKRSAARRDAILAAALDEFSGRGFAATRIDDVARRAGVAKGTIYLHFADKESLFQELIRLELNPVVGALEKVSHTDIPVRQLADRLIEVFAREIFETRRKDVIRLILSEGPRFPALAEFYYREVIVRVMEALRAVLRRAVERGELNDDALMRFPQLLAAPGVVAILWTGLFDRFEPLDVRALMRAHFDALLGRGSGT